VESLGIAITVANNVGLDVVVETVTSSQTLDALAVVLHSTPLNGRLWVCASVDPTRPTAESHVHELITWCAKWSAIPGLNCCTGAQESLTKLVPLMSGIPYSRLAPSAGVGNILAPKPWASELTTMASYLDQPVVAGCCGTTPKHIAALSKLVS
jgi:methionine synthase I (cobalamin-dependent)